VARQAWKEQFRRLLKREFPEWQVQQISSDADLENSLSAVYPRALLKRGSRAWAAMLCPPERSAGSGLLTYALIWLDYLRRRELRLTVEGLAVFVPEQEQQPTTLRIPFLDPCAARFEVYLYSAQWDVKRLDLADYGNLETGLTPFQSPVTERDDRLRQWVERVCAVPGCQGVAQADGNIIVRVRGLEIARTGDGQFWWGLSRRRVAREHDWREIEMLAREVGRVRHPESLQREHTLHREAPERWLEAQVRWHLERVDATLLNQYVYGQVPAMAGCERGILDLLSCDESGRLVVMELKAGEDIHLPIQALDYWMRVLWHAQRGSFQKSGYFGGQSIQPVRPRLVLIAPALEFHPTTETILRFLAPHIETERIGVGVEWRRDLRVMFRLQGAERP
jgi:hypothetical protein